MHLIQPQTETCQGFMFPLEFGSGPYERMMARKEGIDTPEPITVILRVDKLWMLDEEFALVMEGDSNYICYYDCRERKIDMPKPGSAMPEWAWCHLTLYKEFRISHAQMRLRKLMLLIE